MEYLLLLIIAVVLIAIGVVIGVHNANSSSVAPIARGLQAAGSKAVKAVKTAKRK